MSVSYDLLLPRLNVAAHLQLQSIYTRFSLHLITNTTPTVMFTLLRLSSYNCYIIMHTLGKLQSRCNFRIHTFERCYYSNNGVFEEVHENNPVVWLPARIAVFMTNDFFWPTRMENSTML